MIKNHPALSGREEEARVCLASAFSFSLFAFIYIYIYFRAPPAADGGSQSRG